MNREFLINILFLVFINLLIKPFFIFGIDLAVQNRVGAEYGTYFALLNFSYVFQILNDFGVQNFNNRHVSQHPQLLPKYFPNLLALKMILAVLYLGISLPAAYWVAGYGWQQMPLLLVLLCNQVLVQGILFLRSNISGLGFYRTDSVLSSLDKLLMLVFCGALLWGNIIPGPVTVYQFAFAQTISLALTLLIVFFILRDKTVLPLRPGWVRNLRAGRIALLAMLRQSFPYALVVLLMSAYTRLDGILLERLLPDGKMHADVYAGGYRLLDAANMLGFLFASLLLPMFARMLRRGEPVRPLVSTSFKLIWAGSITLAMTVFFARQELIELMMPARASAYRWETLGILIWTFVPVSATYIFSTLLTADRRLMQMNRFFLAGIALDILLNVLLVPRFQAVGSAWATLGTQSFVAMAMIGLCVRNYGFRPSFGGLAGVLGFAASLFGAEWLIFNHTAGPWWGHVLMALAAALAGVFGFGLLRFNFATMLGGARPTK